MERFAAMVSSRRGAPAPPPAPTAEEEVKENQVNKKKEKKGKREEDEAYLSIQLEEIVIVKNEDIIASPYTAAHAGNTIGFGGGACNRASFASPSMEQCVTAATAPPLTGSSTAAAARGAWTTVANIVGFD